MTTPLLHPIGLDRSNVFVKYLPSEIDNEKLNEMFGVFGKIVSAKVMVDQETGLSLGYGFVRFAHPKEAKKAINTMSGRKINNKTLLCRLSNNLAFPEPSTNLYIKPLPGEMTEGQLIEEFMPCGPILTVKIVREKGPPYARIGFVRYENVECASKAIEEKNGTKLSPDLPPLTVKYAESETKRALRKAHALPKHIAKNNAARATQQSFPLDLNLSLANLSLNAPLPGKLDPNVINNNIPSIDINNMNNKNPPMFESPSPVMVPYYVPQVPQNEWYYGQAPPQFNNELAYARTPSYQVLLVPVGDVHFPVYSPRSQWTGGQNFPPNPM